MVHQKIGLPPKWYMGSFQNLLGTLMRIIDDRKEVYPYSKKLAQAITKLLSFEQQLVLDIDRFKMINDSLGHTYGDRFLQEVSERIKKSAEGFDVTIARMGGDEFTRICQNVET
ncbi:hypothetical protein BBR01nite_16430 [Brevibacillus brevis]|nr:hypothetical protein BBR01nite_16430 [Brevibacillus brevis]